MANQKISQMPSLTASELAAGDLLAVVDVSDVTQASSGSNKKITVTELQSAAVSAGTSNGVLYLNGSKQTTSGSALTFDGTNFGVGTASPSSYDWFTTLAVIGKANNAGGVLETATLNASTKAQFYTDANGASLLTNTNHPLIFGVNAAEQMRLTSTGLGIGTSSPGTKLTVAGAAELIRLANAAPYLSFYNAAQSTRFGYIQHNGTNLALVNEQAGVLEMYTSNTLRATLDSSGNLGLGVTPSASWTGKAFQLGAGAFTETTLGGEIAYNTIRSGATSWIGLATGNANRFSFGGGAFAWHTGTAGGPGGDISFTQAMTLDANGNLLVGSTSPFLPSAGRGNISINGASSSILALGVGAVSATYLYCSSNDADLWNPLDGFIRFGTNNTERARIDSSGNLLVGVSSTDSGAKFRVVYGSGANGIQIKDSFDTSGTSFVIFQNGSNDNIATISRAGTTNAVLYNTSSDYRLKNITGPITSSGVYIDSLNPVEGTWKADGSTFVGLIAHEVQEVSRTQVATGEKDGEQMQAMDYSNSELIANLIAEVKSLRARVAALESN